MKSIKRVETTTGILISLFLIIIIFLVAPYYKLTDDMRTILTISTFLFGIFSGFAIASRLTRYSRYRDLLTNETGFLITLYSYSKYVDEKFCKKIADLIDNYLLESFLYEVYEFHEKTEKQFYAIFDEIGKAESSEKKDSLNQMKALLKDMLKDREELYLLGKDRINFWLRTTLTILAGTILYNLLLIRTNAIYSFVLTALLSISVIIVLFLIHDLDKLKLYSEAISYGIYYRVFDAIKKPRLYTNESLQRGMKLPKGISYRLAEIVREKDKEPHYKKISLIRAR